MCAQILLYITFSFKATVITPVVQLDVTPFAGNIDLVGFYDCASFTINRRIPAIHLCGACTVVGLTRYLGAAMLDSLRRN